MKKLLVLPHQGLGDHILCMGLYEELSEDVDKLYILVRRKYVSSVSRMTSSNRKIRIIKIPNSYFWRWMKLYKSLAVVLRINTLGLGTFGANFLIENLRFDQNFYLQVEKPFNSRWEKFQFARNYENEKKLREIYQESTSKPYIFLHEDKMRGYIINRSLIPNSTTIVEPLQMNHNCFTIFDYYELILGAREVHCIESSFAAFIESLNLQNVKLFAHRYARPNAVFDYRYEFSYRCNWIVY